MCYLMFLQRKGTSSSGFLDNGLVIMEASLFTEHKGFLEDMEKEEQKTKETFKYDTVVKYSIFLCNSWITMSLITIYVLNKV